nr:MAG TPA: DNA-directed RNA polymerase subunit [Caudoviricetes sp.]
MTENEKAIEQLERISKNLVLIGEVEDWTEVAIQALEEVQKYRKIGTVEECREAVEKQTAKRPEFVDTRFMNNGKHIYDGCQLQKCYKCPNCNQHIFHVCDDELYCKYCGQHIDWRANDGKTD